MKPSGLDTVNEISEINVSLWSDSKHCSFSLLTFFALKRHRVIYELHLLASLSVHGENFGFLYSTVTK